MIQTSAGKLFNQGLFILYFMLFTATVECGGWQNQYDNKLNFRCPKGGHITQIESRHDNHREDRIWKYECGEGLVINALRCSWTGFVNWWDATMNFKCPHNKVISGVYSYHDNHREDRRWKFLCCPMKNRKLASRVQCHQTSLLNDYDHPMLYQVPQESYITGFYSYHHNGKEDRVWRAWECKVPECEITSIKFKEKIPAKYEGTEIVGVQTFQSCNPDVNFEAHFTKSKTLTELTRITESKTESFSSSTQIGVEYGVEGTAGIEGIASISASWKLTFSKTSTNGREHGFSNTNQVSIQDRVGNSGVIKFKGPKGGMMYVEAKKYSYSKANVPVRKTATCKNGEKIEFDSTMNINGLKYEKVHFGSDTRNYKSVEECRRGDRCLKSIESNDVLTAENAFASLGACFLT